MSSELWGNDYGPAAGPGYRRRVKRLTLDDVPREIARPKSNKRPYRSQTPANQKAAEDRIREEGRVTPRGLKHRIRTLTCNTESFSQLYNELQQANFPGSKVLASSIRNEMLECLRVVIEVGLIDAEDLARHRRRMKKARD